jgi:hypothetical protein
MSDDITINVVSTDAIITNFSSQTNNVMVDLIQANHTIEIVGNPAEITTNVINENYDILMSSAPDIGISINRDGKSAYQVALDNGFVGTESEWLDSLGSGSNSYVTLSALEINNKNIVYAGISDSIMDTDQPIWLIYKLNLLTNIVTYADGNQDYDNVWDDRELLIYS